MSSQNSSFIQEYYKHIILTLSGGNKNVGFNMFTGVLGKFVRDTSVG